MKYAVFALGNRTYEHFNAMGIYVDKRLEELGAKRIHPVGLGDDDANLEDDFITWKETFWNSVCETFDLELVGEDFSMRQYEQTILKEGDYNPDRVYTGEVARLKSFITQRPPFDVKNPYIAPITVNKNLHSSSSDRYCMHIELDISGSRIRYAIISFTVVCRFPTFSNVLAAKIFASLRNCGNLRTVRDVIRTLMYFFFVGMMLEITWPFIP